MKKIKIYTKPIIITSSLVSICLVLFIAVNANRYISRLSENNTELYSAYRISELMKLYKSSMTVLEAKQQGYLVTGDAKFLEEYKRKETEAKTYLKSMEKYFSGKPEEEAFYTLKDLTYKKVMEAKDLSVGTTAVPGIPGNAGQATGLNTMAQINATVDGINESLAQTTRMLLSNSVEYEKVSRNWSFLVIAIGILTALAAVVILFRDVNIRNRLEQELRIAKKQADDNSMLKEQFMANMSHEIRTPMNAILGFSDLLGKTGLGSTQEEYLQAIKNSGSNLLNIINDILDFSRIEAGKLHIEKIPFSVTGVMNSIHTMFAEKAMEKHLAFDVKTGDNMPPLVFGDPTRLNQILVNLVNNAIKFTGNGYVQISAEIKHVEHDIAKLVFKVKDTGIGIPADKLDSIFERFNQGNTETTRKYGGTGLGLAIVKSLVDMQNGDITVKSKAGSGTEFVMTISYPIAYEDIQAAQNSYDTELPKISNHTACVLLAEDNILNQKLATTYLNGFGLQVDIAEHGKQALEKLKTKTYDLVLMDIQMPIMDGYTTTEKIRQDLQLHVPVIAMTAHVTDSEREKCLRCGMNDYISKPFREAELHAVIEKHIHAGDQAVSAEIPSESGAIPEPVNIRRPVVDLQELFELARGSKAFVLEMITIFLEQNPQDIRKLEQAIRHHDNEKAKAQAHKMKTSVGFMGMKPVMDILGEIETHALSDASAEQVKKAFEQVKYACAIARQELQDLMDHPERITL